MLSLILGSGSGNEGTARRVETCLAELVTVTYTLTEGEDLLCALWMDADHVFISVEHEHRLSGVAARASSMLTVVAKLSDDFGTHYEDGVHQTWAAVRR